MSYGPTHQFCPGCNAMLPPHLTECPRCGDDLLKPGGGSITGKEIFQITGVVLLMAIVPLVLMILVGAICIMTAR